MTSYRLRVFVRTSAGEIRRLPLAKFERLLNHDAHTSVPEFANKEMPTAMIVLTVEDGRISGHILGDTLKLKMNARGQVSKRWHEKLLRLSGRLCAASMNELLRGVGPKETSIVSAEHRFLKRHLDDEFHWTPTDGEIAEMVRLARLR